MDTLDTVATPLLDTGANTDTDTEPDITVDNDIDISASLEHITLDSDRLLMENVTNNITPKIKRGKFEKACDNCQKVLKTAKAFETHCKSQVCRATNEITYCKVCDFTCDNHQLYKKHLLSLIHITKIQTAYGIVETIEVIETPLINSVDPYLTLDDVDTITKKTLGSNFTINYRDNRDSQIVKLVKQSNSTHSTPNLNEKNKSNNVATSVNNMPENQLENQSLGGIPHQLSQNGTYQSPQIHTYLQQSQQQPHQQPQPQHQPQSHIHIEATTRQQKIITYLEGYKNLENCGEKLIEILKEKLQIEDYKNLQALIKQSENMTCEMISAYVTAINKFSMAMVKLKNKGVSKYKDKDITMIVMNLTA